MGLVQLATLMELRANLAKARREELRTSLPSEVRGASLYFMSASRGAPRWSLHPSKGNPPKIATTRCRHGSGSPSSGSTA